MAHLCLNHGNNDERAAGSVLCWGALEKEKKMSAPLLPWFQHFTSQHHLSGIHQRCKTYFIPAIYGRDDSIVHNIAVVARLGYRVDQ